MPGDDYNHQGNRIPDRTSVRQGRRSKTSETITQREVNPVVKAFAQMEFAGNVIPLAWFQHPDLRLDDGKVCLPALVLLADICYWYRPAEERDEEGRVIAIRQKFQRDRLQMRYAEWAEKFGLTVRQCKDATAFLKKKRIITIELRDLVVGEKTYRNCTFFEPIPEKIQALSEPTQADRDGLKGGTLKRVTPSDVPRSHVKPGNGGTFKRASTETSGTETSGTDLVPPPVVPPPPEGGADTTERAVRKSADAERAEAIAEAGEQAFALYNEIRMARCGSTIRKRRAYVEGLGVPFWNMKRDVAHFRRAVHRFFDSDDDDIAEALYDVKFFVEEPEFWLDSQHVAGDDDMDDPYDVDDDDDPFAHPAEESTREPSFTMNRGEWVDPFAD